MKAKAEKKSQHLQKTRNKKWRRCYRSNRSSSACCLQPRLPGKSVHVDLSEIAHRTRQKHQSVQVRPGSHHLPGLFCWDVSCTHTSTHTSTHTFSKRTLLRFLLLYLTSFPQIGLNHLFSLPVIQETADLFTVETKVFPVCLSRLGELV